MHGLLLFDFDGTLYRGQDPFRFYAGAIASSMTPAERAAYLARVEDCLAGRTQVEAGDYWEAVVKLAQPTVTDGALLQRAFSETREYMMEDDCRLEVPEGLSELLEAAAGRVVRVVASNSPEAAMIPLLRKLGLLDLFDEVRHSTGKPAGLGPLVDGLLSRYQLGDDAVMTVGDHYANEIEQGVERGWVTVHIDPWNQAPGPADVRGRSFEDVRPAIQAWVDTVSGG